ncbi:MAG: hypothetical protein V4572_04630 [Bacteroidota bacterium]
MKRLRIPHFIIYNLYLFIVCIFVTSCVNQEKEYEDSIFKLEATQSEPLVDFNLIDCLNESNKKTITLAGITFNQTKNLETLKLILKIKRDHQKIDAEFKKLVEKNLIIIPKLVYNLNIDSDSLKGKKSPLYLSNLLVTEIENQIIMLDQMEQTSKNIDFKIFAIQTKKILKANNNALKISLNI